MPNYIAEFIGTAILVLLGDGVVANVCLRKTKGNGSGWIVITTGWALAVAIPVFIFGDISGAHFNPAVTLGMATIGSLPWADVLPYIVAQMLGGIVGACLVYLAYLPHFREETDKGAILGTFATAPAIKSTAANFITEFIATFCLLFFIIGVGNTKMAGGINPIVVGMIIWVLGLTLGGPTGYALNPARDLGPRIAHAFLPIPNKGDSDWGYSWVPVVAPICGGIVACLLANAIF